MLRGLKPHHPRQVRLKFKKNARFVEVIYFPDSVFIYHSMNEAAVMGMAVVASEPRPDPKDAKLEVVDLEFLTRLDAPITLREIKESHLFDDWSLVRQSRLSHHKGPKAFAEWMRKKHGKTKV